MIISSLVLPVTTVLISTRDTCLSIIRLQTSAIYRQTHRLRGSRPSKYSTWTAWIKNATCIYFVLN